MRADRLLALLMLLQSRGRMTASELAKELEVSERTVYRDIVALGTSGVPVLTEHGPGGGIRLMERYRSDLTGLTQDEVQALFMLSIPAPLTELGLDQRLKDALYKLAAALPATFKGYQERVRQRIHIDSDGWEPAGDGSPHLLSLQRAIWDERMLVIDYRTLLGSRFGLLTARVAPYGLVAKAGRWFLVAFRVDHMAVFRVEQVANVSRLEEDFERSVEFDLVSFWQDWCKDNKARRPQFQAVVEISDDLRPFLKSVVGEATAVEIERPAVEIGNGCSLWQLQFTSFEEARGRILALGAAAKVIAPMSLKLSVQDYARQITVLYGE